MSATQALPWYVGTTARLHIVNGDDSPFVVILSTASKDATPAALMRPGGMSVVITHDRGMAWPDRKGEALARAMIEAGGVAAFAFIKLADAMACHRRITGGGTT